MFRNYVITALRNLAHNRLYAAINVIGLAVGFAAIIFAALFVRDQLTYDQWIPGYRQIYAVSTTYAPNRFDTPEEHIGAYRDVATWLKNDFPQVQTASRMSSQGEVVMHHGNVREAEQFVSSASADLFATLPVPSVAGDLRTALDRPDSIVLSRKMARKYFGRDAPIGDVIDLNPSHLPFATNWYPMRVTAVIEDWPSNTEFSSQAFISEHAPFSSLRNLDAQGRDEAPFAMFRETYVHLKPGASIETLQPGMAGFVGQHIPKDLLGDVKMRLIPLTSVHLDSPETASNGARGRLLTVIYGVAALGGLVLLAAGINFVNLMTARGARRAIEVKVRKVTGASRPDLIAQFIGESLLYVVLSAVLGVALVKVLLPAFDALLDRNIVFDCRHDAPLLAGTLGLTITVGILGGSYPAFVLSAFSPVATTRARGSGIVRQALVMSQFAILIGLVVATAVIYRQTEFATNESLRFNKDQVLEIRRGCSVAMKDAVEALPGVRAATCGWGGIGGSYGSTVRGPNGVELRDRSDINISPMDFEFFDVLGLRPLAGRFFARDRGEDVATADGSTNPSVVINETAVRKLGFSSPAAAVGQIVSWRRLLPSRRAVDSMPLLPSQIIGVVPDFSESVQDKVRGEIYYADMTMSEAVPAYGYEPQSLSAKLTGHDIPVTLRTIDQIWNQLGDNNRPISKRFMDQQIEERYRELTRQAHLTAAFAVVAVVVAALGLFGLSAFTSELRTKEIGIRKSLGADTSDMVKLLMWQFVKPVLWANVIAWPIAAYLMHHWLQGFAYHVDLDPLTFLGASVLALAIALATVAGHALVCARAKPVAALRYE